MSASKYRRPVEEHLSVETLAERLDISQRSVYRLINEGRRTNGQRGIWPVRKVGKSTRIPASAVNRCLEAASLS